VSGDLLGADLERAMEKDTIINIDEIEPFDPNGVDESFKSWGKKTRVNFTGKVEKGDEWLDHKHADGSYAAPPIDPRIANGNSDHIEQGLPYATYGPGATPVIAEGASHAIIKQGYINAVRDTAAAALAVVGDGQLPLHVLPPRTASGQIIDMDPPSYVSKLEELRLGRQYARDKAHLTTSLTDFKQYGAYQRGIRARLVKTYEAHGDLLQTDVDDNAITVTTPHCGTLTWKKLAHNFTCDTPQHRERTKAALDDCVQQQGEPVTTYAQRKRKLLTAYNDCGGHLSEPEKVSELIKGLGPQFCTWNSIRRTARIAYNTLDDLTRVLVEEETTLPTADAHTHALYSGTGRQRPSQGGEQRQQPCRDYARGRCTYGERCRYLHDPASARDTGAAAQQQPARGEPATARGGPATQQPANGGAQNGSRTRCYVCGDREHQAANCPDRYQGVDL
jgi:hypothetical protein